jgi:oligoendopeptidase F
VQPLWLFFFRGTVKIRHLFGGFPIKTRRESVENISAPTRWSLNDLLEEPVEQSLENSLAKLETLTAAFETAREQLNDNLDRATFVDLIGRYENILRHAHRLEAYAQLAFYADTQDPAILNLRNRIKQVLTEIENRTLFFTLWIKGWDDETATRFTPDMGDYRHFVQTLLKLKPHTLQENEEQIINLKDANGINGMVGLYEMMTSGYTFTIDVDGDRQTLTRDQLMALTQHPSADVRARAYQELFRVYEENSAVLAQIYNHRVRDWHAESLTLRRYESAIAPRNLSNDIPDKAVDTLLEVCAANNDLFQRYFRLKANWLGMDRLRRYDIYAPLKAADKTYTYAQAYALVMESFDAFLPEIGRQARRVFDENHIDSEARSGKRGGAFCYGVVPELTPWVLVNFTGKARDVATLAHELGHAIHSMQAGEHSYLTYHPSLPLAETASVFAEMLLTERLLAQENDSAVRKEILAHALDNAYATVQRQAYFTIFEREAHRRIIDGDTVEQLSAHYMENLRDQFGDALVLSHEFKWEWIAIPHMFFAPFYTYAYSFGQLLVLALYRQYRAEGETFIPRYLKLLSVGGSAEPAQVLSDAGFDVTSPAFWQGGYDVLREMVDELEALG